MLIHFHQFINKLKNTPAWKNKLILISSGIGILINILIWLLIYYKFYPAVYNLPEEQAFIPLHYNIYLGIDLFGRWQKIFYLPGIGLAIFLINTIFALIIYNKKELVSYFLTITSTVCQVLLFFSTLLTILINI
ncbi:hypothetical protein HN858_01830 [Candidatus Falkowbacteria bacterium]|jgi:hypothetical protein|nr:hypothetical protein [Candidatus Falkowbacteria bacterium]MBT6573586.1 hypothetical protein [Candidatus Falkowbacteria bacterium]MBT7348394.1 hypothetical protein [Candidatus Falkowbacteria bacterium]MBT7500652.1 hypothetical protein [Candidatus Falkowbacteria bacterium]